MKITEETLHLTWTIAPTLGIKKFYKNTLDPRQRLKEYDKAIKFYIKMSQFKNIVFCENSNYSCKHRKKSIYKLAKMYDKNLEILQFEWSNKTLILSYSYWEGECIDYAFDNSTLIKNSNNWRKITGRYIITNINEITSSSNTENLLFKWMWPLQYFMIDTSFFKVTNMIYEKYLYNAKNDITVKNKKCIESLYYDRLRYKDIHFWRLKILPIKEWFRDSGYNKRWYHGILLKLWFRNEGTYLSYSIDKVAYWNVLFISFVKKLLLCIWCKI